MNGREKRLAVLSGRTEAGARVLLANRVLANIGWTDEARAASIKARQAQAKPGGAVKPRGGVIGGIRANGTYGQNSKGETVFAPDRRGEGQPYVDREGDVWVTAYGKPARIGSGGVVKIQPDGTLAAVIGGKSYPVPIDRVRLLQMSQNPYREKPGMLIPVGDGFVASLDTGKVLASAGHYAGNFGRVGVFK